MNGAPGAGSVSLVFAARGTDDNGSTKDPLLILPRPSGFLDEPLMELWSSSLSLTLSKLPYRGVKNGSWAENDDTDYEYRDDARLVNEKMKKP